ncbi:hypothetical protein [Paenibacillus glycinis]|uniref:Uncharacterized protein n=1 Tax=Paenibacillus glycinis TaxID=2697035 RepID=A0ABW9XWV3_9BACL|nr:hypothetical protein [Paenibacillus glycinis]NBD27203.1 hypothetical protein [Paenibacillus glycinis]
MRASTDLSFAGHRGVTYTITTQGATYANEAIEASLIRELIGGFELDPNDFIVIDPSVLIEGSSYMQAVPSGDAENGIAVELRLDHPDGSFKHYSYSTGDVEEVMTMFLAYWGLQKLPDWTGWRDITDQF